jgi:hypothetical protein
MTLKPMAAVKQPKRTDSDIAQIVAGVKKTRWTYTAIKLTTSNAALKYSLELPVVGLPAFWKYSLIRLFSSP